MNNNEILNQISITTPCPVSWSTMNGDDKVRFCSMCQLHVYNISNMTASEATDLIREKEGKMCVQLVRRRDGTVITENCPVALRKIRDTVRRSAVLLISMGCWLGLGQQAQAHDDGEAKPKPKATGTASFATTTVEVEVPPAIPVEAPNLQGATNGTIDPSIYSAATNGTIGGGMTLYPGALQELEQRRLAAEAVKANTWLLAIPASLGISIMWFMRRKLNSSITRMAVISGCIVSVLGAIWGFLSGV